MMKGGDNKERRPVMKCKCFDRTDRPGRYGVYLSWRGKIYRRFTYTDGLTLKSEQYALRLSERINADIEEKGKNFRPSNWFGIHEKRFKFTKYAEEWLDRQTHLAPSYFPDVKRFVNNYWIPFFQNKDIREITSGDLEDFLFQLPKRLAAKTKLNIISSLRKLINDAYRREDIHRVTCPQKWYQPLS